MSLRQELHEAGASALALLEAGVHTPDLLRQAGCTAAEAKEAGGFSKAEMEGGGYPLLDATQMRAGGFTCAEVKHEGYLHASTGFETAPGLSQFTPPPPPPPPLSAYGRGAAPTCRT